MPENDFEKQVQQKMDELRFEPSEAVWTEVEKEIKEKKKRRIIFWLPLFGLLLGGAAWLYFENAKNNTGNKNTFVQTNVPALEKAIDKDATAPDKNKQAVDAANDKQDNNGEPNESNNALNKGKENTVTTSNKTKAETIAADKKILTETNNKTVAEKAVTVESSNKEINASNKFRESKSGHRLIGTDKSDSYNKPATQNIDNSAVANGGNRKLQHKKASNKQAATADESPVEKNANDDVAEKSLATNDVNSNKTNTPSTTVDAAQIAVNKSATDSTTKQLKPDTASAVAKNKTTDKSKKKLDWGIHIQGGKSAVSSGFTNLFSGTPSYSDRNFSGNFSSAPANNNSSGIGTGGSTSLPPADIKPGFSFGAGVFVSKALPKNTSLQVGLNYNYISTQIAVGTKNTSNASLVQYNTGNASTYNNQFHFIELPVNVQKQLSAKSRFSLSAGLSFSWLLATNTLLYNSQNNTYFKDKSQVNKFQWGLQGGVFYKLFPRSFPIQVGPQFYYSANNIFDKQTYGSRHLMFAGLQANIFLPKKKQ